MCEIKEYSEFVDSMLSAPTKKLNKFVERLEILDQSAEKCNIPSLMAGSTGLVCEAAELKDIVKKVLFQGKELTPELIEHMKKELGDVAFYFVLLCQAINTTPSEVMDMNMEKLSARFAGGGFSVKESETRKPGDV